MNYTKTDPKTIQALFDSIASDYDTTNGILSFQLHRFWNKKLIHALNAYANAQTLLDLCCGSGEIGLGWLTTQSENKELFLLDFSENMLLSAKKKAAALPLQQHHITYLQADAQVIPLPKDSVDCVSIAYGIRNVQDPMLCFQEVHRVLKTNGFFAILELTEPQNKLLKWGHSFYLKTVLPALGGMITKNKDAYRYLSTSIPTFLKPIEMQNLLLKSGFSISSQHLLCGGIATLWIAQKQSQTQ